MTVKEEAEWRRFGLFVAVLLFTGCASVPKVMDYDEALFEGNARDSATYVRLRIQNHRISDAIDPRFYLVGAGSHSLGVVRGMGGSMTRLVDTAWFGADGCMTVVAHYAGVGDWVSPRFCWTPGNVIDVNLQELIATSSAWAHR